MLERGKTTSHHSRLIHLTYYEQDMSYHFFSFENKWTLVKNFYVTMN